MYTIDGRNFQLTMNYVRDAIKLLFKWKSIKNFIRLNDRTAY